MTGAPAGLDGVGNTDGLDRRRSVLPRFIGQLFVLISPPAADLLIGVDDTGMSLRKKGRPAPDAEMLGIIDVGDGNRRLAVVSLPIAELTIFSPSPALDLSVVETGTAKPSPRRYPGRIRYVIDRQRIGVFVRRRLRPDLTVRSTAPAVDLSAVDECATLIAAGGQGTGAVEFDVDRR